jgi:RimJ/RimL family protein N-acetyltransferase
MTAPEDAPAWHATDGVVTIRQPHPGDAEVLIAGRDPEWERWLGPGDDDPHPTAVIVTDVGIVGWVDAATGPDWLGPDELNVGYNVLAPHRRRGYATRAVLLLTRWVSQNHQTKRLYLAVDAENAASLGVARAVGAVLLDQYLNETGRPQLRFVIDLRASRE